MRPVTPSLASGRHHRSAVALDQAHFRSEPQTRSSSQYSLRWRIAEVVTAAIEYRRVVLSFAKPAIVHGARQTPDTQETPLLWIMPCGASVIVLDGKELG